MKEKKNIFASITVWNYEPIGSYYSLVLYLLQVFLQITLYFHFSVKIENYTHCLEQLRENRLFK